MPRRSLPAVLAAGLLLLTGCADDRGASASGVVTLDGQPVEGAEVSLMSETGETGSFGSRTDGDGKFRVTGVASRPMPPGQYKVHIVKYVARKGTVTDPEELEELRMAGQVRNVLPAKYSSSDAAVLSVEVKPGSNQLPPFELKSR